MSEENKSFWQKVRKLTQKTKNLSDTKKNNYDSNVETIRKPRILMGLVAGVINLFFWGLGSIILGKNLPLNISFFFIAIFLQTTNYLNIYQSENQTISVYFLISLLLAIYGIYAGITNKEIIKLNPETSSQKKSWYSKKIVVVIFLLIIGGAVHGFVGLNPHAISSTEIDIKSERAILSEICMRDESPIEQRFFSGKSELRIFCGCYVDLALSQWTLDEIFALEESIQTEEPSQELLDFVDDTWKCWNKKSGY